MGLTRNQDTWSNGYRYLTSPFQEPMTYSTYPINEIAQTGENCRTDLSVGMYQEYQQQSSFSHITSVHPLSHPTYITNQISSGPCGSTSIINQSGQDLGRSTINQSAHPQTNYLPSFTDIIQNPYGYTLDNYGSTNVGTAVAMSLGSLNTLGTTRECESQVVDSKVQSTSNTLEQCNNQGEYLLSELLSGDPDLPLLDMCKSNEDTAYYKSDIHSAAKAIDNTTDSTLSSADSTYGVMTGKTWGRAPHRVQPNQIPDCGTMQELSIFHMVDNPSRQDEEQISYSPSQQLVTGVQKKYKFYGKWRPNDEKEDGKLEVSEEYQHCSQQQQQLQENQYDFTRCNKLPQYPYTDNRGLFVERASDNARSSPSELHGESFAYGSSGSYHQFKTAINEDSNDSERSETNDSDSRSGSTRSEDRVSKDEKRARALKIPLNTSEIVSLPIDEFNERLSKYELNDPQLSLIRDIRRRGKNKVAAQNCRKRKLDQIYTLQKEVEVLLNNRSHLETEQERCINKLGFIEEKYCRLCELVMNRKQSTGDNIQVQDIFVQQ